MVQADGTETLYVEIPPSLKYLVDEDDRTNKEVVIAALERELGVSSEDSLAVLDRKIRRKEQRLEEAQERIRDEQDQRSTLKNDLERLREIRETRVEDDGSYTDLLDAVLDDLEAGEIAHLPYYHNRIDAIREEFDRPADEIHFDLQERAAEQERDLLNTRFMEKRRANSIRRSGDERPIAESWDGDSE